MTLFKPAATYFGLVFGAGFLLGTIRVLWIVPRLGTRWAELAEAPLMCVAIVLAARCVVARFCKSSTPARLLAVGLLATGILLAAELAVGILLRGMSPAQVFTDRDPISGTVYYLLLAIFTVMPWLIARLK